MDPMDSYIGRQIKNSAAKSRPPANLKARILQIAAHPAPVTSIKYHPAIQVYKPEKEWAHDFFDWAVMGNTGMGAVNMRVML